MSIYIYLELQLKRPPNSPDIFVIFQCLCRGYRSPDPSSLGDNRERVAKMIYSFETSPSKTKLLKMNA